MTSTVSVEEFIVGVPKCELHLHIEGTLEAEMTFDLAVHSWDLGKAIGYGAQLPRELAEFVLAQLDGAGDLSGSGMFAEPVDVAGDATPQDKLVAATGRDPGWTPPA